MITFYIFKFFEFFLFRFSTRVQKNIFSFLGWFAYKIDKKHRRIIRQNLSFIYGNSLSEKKIDFIERYCYKNLLFNFMQIAQNRHLDLNEIVKNVTLEPKSIIELAQEEGRPIIFATGHFGRWELGGALISQLIKPSMIVYKQMTNPYFQDYLNASREKFRITSIEKHGAVKHLIKQLRKGDAIALLVDTNLSKNDGVMVDFFGRPTRTTATTAFLARKTGALIIPVGIVTDDEEHFTIKFSQPIEVAQSEDEDADILEATQKQASALEAMVREYPQLWFWLHKRWKTDNPEIYAG
jgi:KDO2-lipid IV(A) lauroyltransferase